MAATTTPSTPDARIRFSDAGEIMSGRLDMTLMYAMHNALRRELEHIAKITARIDDDPRRILASAAVGRGDRDAAAVAALRRGSRQPDRSRRARLTPWLLDGADEQTVATMLALLPEPVRAAYRDQWQPAYAALDRWNAIA